jgi:hypothetical protein
LLCRFPRGHYCHFSWDGPSFRLRDFLGGKSAAQDSATISRDVYEAGTDHEPCVGDLAVPVTNTEFWIKTLTKKTEAVSANADGNLGRNEIHFH